MAKACKLATEGRKVSEVSEKVVAIRAVGPSRAEELWIGYSKRSEL